MNKMMKMNYLDEVDELHELDEVNELHELDEVDILHELNKLDELHELDEVESTSSSWMKYFVFKTWSTSFIHLSKVVHEWTTHHYRPLSASYYLPWGVCYKKCISASFSNFID